MKVKGINNSSKRTKEMIRKEFAILLAEKHELRKITVTELTNNLGITRGAFYSHYDSIDDVAKEFQTEALELLGEDIKSISDIESFLDKINIFLKENEEAYNVILKTNDPMIFMERLNKMANIKLMELLSTKNNNKYLKLNISVFIDGLINLYIKYFRNELEYSLDEINRYSKTLFNIMFIRKD